MRKNFTVIGWKMVPKYGGCVNCKEGPLLICSEICKSFTAINFTRDSTQIGWDMKLFHLFLNFVKNCWVNIPSLTQIRFTIHLAIPRNRQCIRSTIKNRIESKYGSRSNSDHLTPVSF